MADDKFTSLLGKSSGTSFGELAGAYLSGGKKKDNRARNIMLGTLVFNVKENQMRSKVMKNLDSLEREKVLEQARLTKQWEEREKLQTEYEAVKNKGAYKFYKTDAEEAFEETHGADEKYDLKAYQQEKINWMKNWSNKKEDDLNKRYSGVDTNILTKEEFMAPVNDYYKAKQQDYLNPQNTSLVHKALGKIGFGTDRSEETGNFLNKKGEDAVYNYRKNKEAHQTRIDTLTSQDIQEIKMDSYKYDDSVKITDEDFNTLLSKNGILTGTSAEQLRAQRKAYVTFNSGNKSYESGQQAITNAILSYDIDATISQAQEVRRAYEQYNGKEPKLTTTKDLESLSTLEGSKKYSKDSIAWNAGLKKQIAISFGIKDLTAERETRASAMFELGLNSGLYNESERTKIYQDIIGEDLRVATGGFDYNGLKKDIIGAQVLETVTILGENPLDSNRRQRADMMIKRTNFVEQEDKQFLQTELTTDAYTDLKNANFNMTEFKKTHGTKYNNTVDAAIILELQQSIWMDRRAELAGIAASNSVIELKKLDGS
jgi:hypothetical protein